MSRADLLGTNPELAIDHIRARSRKNARTAHDGRKLALIVEGGAMRGVFSSGANTALEKIGLTSAFDEVYSCSAGAINAAIYAAEIIATFDPRVAEQLVSYKQELARSVAEKSARVKEQFAKAAAK